MAAISISWLTYTGTMYAITGGWGSASTYVDAAAFQLLLAFVQAGMVRYFGKEAIVLGRPRMGAWTGLTILTVLLVYALTLAVQLLAYLAVPEFVGSLRWHQAIEAAVAVTVAFPFTVWQIALLAGDRRAGLARVWKGVWRDRPVVPVIVLLVMTVLAVAQVELQSLASVKGSEFELILSAVPALLAGSAAFVFLTLLAFVTFLAIARDLATVTGVFD
jgi:hypothetical protein